MDVRERAQAVLETILPIENVQAEAFVSDSIPNEYIVYKIRGGGDSRHASNRPLLTEWDVEVTYVCKDINKKLSVPLMIKSKMVGAGFYCTESGRDLAREPNSKFFGVILEFNWIGGALE